MNIDGKDIEMQHPICYDKEYDKWLVSKCGKIWSIKKNKVLVGHKSYTFNKNSKRIKKLTFSMMTEKDFWEDGSGSLHHQGYSLKREIAAHKMIIDTWKPLYDNPPEGVSWETWEKIRDFPDNFKFYSQSVVIDHIDDDPTNNHLDNLRRVTQWDNQPTRKAKGI
jgi:hypothetical protein